jgi:hypothetical protein
MAFTNDDAYRDFTKSFNLTILGEKISWVPGQLDLIFDPTSDKAAAIADSLEDFANKWCNYEYEIAVTPVGPFLVNDITDPYTFVWAANALYGDTGIEVVGEAPTMEEMGLGGKDYDKNKSPRIY